MFWEDKLAFFPVFIEFSSMKHFSLVNGKHSENITFHIFTSITLCLHNVENSGYHVSRMVTPCLMFPER